MTTVPMRAASAGVLARVVTASYTLLLTACVVVSLGWLAIGALIAAATYSPGVSAAMRRLAAEGSGWAEGVLAALPRSEPLDQAVLDYAFSALNLTIAGTLLFLGLRTWVTQLLAVAMISSAGAFNLQAHAATVAVKTATGLDIGVVHQVLLHGVACAAYVVALLLLPAGTLAPGPRAGRGRWVLLGVTAGTLVVVGVGTALLPHTVSCVLFFGFGVPLVGLAVLPSRIRFGSTAELRTQARLLFSVLLAAFGTSAVLAVLTLLLWYLGEPGLVLVDPTAHGPLTGDEPAAAQPTALLFWFSRLTSAGIGASVLVAIRRGRLWAAERVFSRGLASMMVIVLVGGGYVVAHAVVGWLPGTGSGGGAVAAAALATALASVAFLPVYVRAERLVDRLLYGQRPTPYRVLADIAALARTATTSGEGPDLAGLAEAIGRGLGARSCRLTVLRPGLRERTYSWSDGAAGADEDLVVLPVRQGQERIGAIAVDRGAVAGLHNERRTLLEDVADSLGAVLQASRLGIELERELRAALAHAEDIAVSRRQAVAEMDSERRMIERDLHDGAQHHLVSLRLALGLVEHEVGSGQLAQAGDRLEQLTDQVGETEVVLAKTATGVSSIVLTERGLAAALGSVLATDLIGPEAVDIGFGDGVVDRRFGADIEAAVYFCCLEAVNNARKHAAGASVSVRVEAADGRLRFSVRDDGPGFDPAANAGSAGRGMRNVVARIASVGGRVDVDSAPGAGTTVHGWVPLPTEPPTEPPATPSPATAPPATAPPTTAPPTTPSPATPSEPPAVPSDPPTVDTPAVQPAAPPRPRPTPRRRTTAPEPATAPLPVATQPALTPPASKAAPPPEAVPDPAANGDRSLLGRTRALVRAAIDCYPDGPERDRLDELSALLDRPLRVAVVGPAGAGKATLLRALATLPGPPLEPLFDEGARDERAPPQAVLLLLGDRADDLPECPVADVPAIGLLTRADERGGSGPDALEVAARLAEEYHAHPDVARRCQLVIPVAALLAEGAAALGPDGFEAARALARRPHPPDETDETDGDEPDEPPPAPLAGLGRFGARAAVELVRDEIAPTPERLAEELVRLSGLPRVRDVLTWRFTRPAEASKVRAALRSLNELLRATPPGGGERVDELRYQLDRLRAGAHELVEADLAEALRAGSVRLSEADRGQAERLLGARGMTPADRLGLASGVGPGAIRDAARDQLAYWQRLASHPVTTAAVRDAADVLARTCEELLTDAIA